MTMKNNGKPIDLLGKEDEGFQSMLDKIFGGFCDPDKMTKASLSVTDDDDDTEDEMFDDDNNYHGSDPVACRQVHENSVDGGVPVDSISTSVPTQKNNGEATFDTFVSKDDDDANKNNKTSAQNEDMNQQQQQDNNQVSSKARSLIVGKTTSENDNTQADVVDCAPGKQPRGILRQPGQSGIKKAKQRAVSFQSGRMEHWAQCTETTFFMGLLILLTASALFQLGYFSGDGPKIQQVITSWGMEQHRPQKHNHIAPTDIPEPVLSRNNNNVIPDKNDGPLPTSDTDFETTNVEIESKAKQQVDAVESSPASMIAASERQRELGVSDDLRESLSHTKSSQSDGEF